MQCDMETCSRCHVCVCVPGTGRQAGDAEEPDIVRDRSRRTQVADRERNHRRVSTFMYFYVLLCNFMHFYVLLCTFMYFYVLLCTFMYFYVLLCTFMYFYVFLCTFMYFSTYLIFTCCGFDLY